MAEASFTIFSDANSPGWAEAFAALLRDESSVYVNVVDSVTTVEDRAPEPTRTFNRIMQMAVVKARSCNRFQANALDALWALCGERDVPAADLLERYEISRADVAARLT